jgi:AraC-like DNA-binding protein
MELPDNDLFDDIKFDLAELLSSKIWDLSINHPTGFNSRIETFCLDCGFIFCLTNFNSPCPLEIASQNICQAKGFGFNLCGEVILQSFLGIKEDTCIKPGQMSIYSTPFFETYKTALPAGRVIQVSITRINEIDREKCVIDDIISEISVFKTNTNFMNIFSITTDLNKILEAILYCSYTGPLRKIYLEAKALELFTLAISKLTSNGSDYLLNNSLLSRKEVDMAQQAAVLLVEDFESIPSLGELSKKIGLSRCRLIQIFKQVHGITPFAYLKNYRLSRAKEMILEEKINITQAAAAVGYSSLSHFSKAFAEKFDCQPSHLHKK